MKTRLFIEGRRDCYDVKDIDYTMTVGELIEYLEQFDEDMPIYLNNDNGYTFGGIYEESFEEVEDEEIENDEDDDEGFKINLTIER